MIDSFVDECIEYEDETDAEHEQCAVKDSVGKDEFREFEFYEKAKFISRSGKQLGSSRKLKRGLQFTRVIFPIVNKSLDGLVGMLSM